MRIIAGEAKGRRLASPKSNDIRPALDQVKEAIFNILFDVTGFSVLDLFAGTGSMGLEALSRGAKETVFVDNSKEALELIHKNLKLLDMQSRGDVFAMPVGKAIDVLARKGRTFDLIFVDPPYEKGFVAKMLKQLGKSAILKPETILIVEHHPKEPIPSELGRLSLTDERKYGQTLVSFLKPTL